MSNLLNTGEYAFRSYTFDNDDNIWFYGENNGIAYSEYKYSTLKYYRNNAWIDFDISGINKQILTVNADINKVYIGTIKG